MRGDTSQAIEDLLLREVTKEQNSGTAMLLKLLFFLFDAVLIIFNML